MRRRLLSVLAIFILALIFWSVWPVNAPSPHRPIITVETRVLDTLRDYLRDNDLEQNERELRDLWADAEGFVDYVIARADESYRDDPGGAILAYESKNCPVSFPPGRQLSFTYRAGLIEDFDSIFPLEPLTWDEMQAMVRDVVSRFEEAGWPPMLLEHDARYHPPRVPILPEHFASGGTKWARIGYWQHCETPWIKGYAEVRHYNSSSSGSFMPPAALSKPVSEDAEDRFLLRVRFSIADAPGLDDELRTLRDARRLAVNGDRSQEIPIALWIDDPGWRPEGWSGAYIR